MNNARRKNFWIAIGICAALLCVAAFLVLPALTRAEGGSWVQQTAKLADCTNQHLTIKIRSIPPRGLEFLLGIPDGLTNSIEGLAGSLIFTSRSRTTNTFTISPHEESGSIPVFEPAPEGNALLYTGQKLRAYRIGGAKPPTFKVGAAFKVEVIFSNSPPAAASVWARWKQAPIAPLQIQ